MVIVKLLIIHKFVFLTLSIKLKKVSFFSFFQKHIKNLHINKNLKYIIYESKAFCRMHIKALKFTKKFAYLYKYKNVYNLLKLI